jgi:hypothetical protein
VISHHGGDPPFGATRVPRLRPRRRTPRGGDSRVGGGPGLPPLPSRRPPVRAAVGSPRFGPLPPRRFRALLTPLSRFFSPFRRRTCSLSVSPQCLALDETYHPIRAALPSGPTLRRARSAGAPGLRTGMSPSSSPPFQADREPDDPLAVASPPHPPGPSGPGIRFGRRPLRSPLPRTSPLVSLPPVINMLKFAG